MENEILLSFIIPAYNAADFLQKAVESINNTNCISNYEILIIENGSTDNTTDVANKLIKNNISHIKFFHSSKGVSNARNLGIKKASGKWLVFLDADDYIKTDELHILYEDALSAKSDLYMYGYEIGSKHTKAYTENKYYTGQELEKLKVKMIENPTNYMQVWSKLFNKNIIMKNNIFFNPLLRLSEDSDFMIRYLNHCYKVCSKSTVLYHYSLNNGSTMRVYDKSKACAYEEALKITEAYVSKQDSQMQHAYSKYILMHLNIIFAREVFCLQNKESYSKKINTMKQLSQKKIFYNAINTVKLKDVFKPRLLPLFFLKQRLYFLSSLGYFLRACQNYIKEQKG